MRSLIFLCYVMLISGCAVSVGAHDYISGDLDAVFGGVDVGKNSTVGNISSVNGGIDIESGVTARHVNTVNGSIELSDRVSIESAETVNGGIDAGSSLVVKDSLETVNGGIQVGELGSIGGSVITVNGDIELARVTVDKNIETVNGDILLTNGTTIRGDLVIEKSGGWFSSIGSDKLVVKIDKSSTVVGTIHLHKKVKLEIDEGAKVGQVKEYFLRE